MSYSIDRSRAVALQQCDGVWSLEVEHLVRVTRNTFRPKRKRVTGVDAIMQHLALNEGPLVGATKAVFEREAGGLEARFELQAGGWVPVPTLEDLEVAPVADSGFGAPSSGTALAEAADNAEAEQLRERIQQLERTVELLTGELERSNLAVGDADPGLSELLEGATGGEAAPEDPAEPEPEFASLKMPALDAVSDLVKGLAGDEVVLRPVDSGQWDLSTDEQAYLTPLRSDDGEIIGALVLSLEATIRLAGAMLMEPAEELDAQVESQEPSDDILDAAGEVLNTLTSAVNKVSGNAHVRAAGLEGMDLGSFPWLKKPRVRTDFASSLGGSIAIVGR